MTRWRQGAIVTAVCAAAMAALGVATVRAATAAGPFRHTALWIGQVPATATPAALARLAIASGARALYVKAADGATPDSQFTPALVRSLKAAGVSVCGWTFAYGADPRGEATAAVAAARAGAQCLVVDAEGQYDKRYGAAQIFVRTVRSRVGRGVPIGLAGQAEVARHPTFPYSVFLGPGGFGYDLPQMYWRDLHVPSTPPTGSRSPPTSSTGVRSCRSASSTDHRARPQ